MSETQVIHHAKAPLCSALTSSSGQWENAGGKPKV